MESHTSNEESRAGSSSSSVSTTRIVTEVQTSSGVHQSLSSSLRGISPKRRALSPYRRVHFELDERQSEGNDSNNVSTQTESAFLSVAGRYCSTAVLEDIRKMGRSFWSSKSISSIMDYMRDLDERPKTGYTYASSLSYDLCGDPNPGMPNMSRHSLDYYATQYKQHGLASSALLSSRKTSSWKSSRDSIRIPQLDFSMASTTSPEPPTSGLRHSLSSMCRKIVNLTTTTTTTTTTNHRNNIHDLADDEERNPTPESRPGNYRLDAVDYRNLDQSSSQYQNGHTFTNGGFSLSPSVSKVETIKRRLIDVVTNTWNTITTTESDVVGEKRKRRRRCLFWPFCLLLLPLFWGTYSAVSSTSGQHFMERAESAASRIYGHFLPFWMPSSSVNPPIASESILVKTKNDSDDGTIRIIQTPCDLSSLPVPKTCCEDVDLIKTQVGLILTKLDNLDKQSGERERWMKEREAIFDRTKLTVEELQLILIRLEKEVNTKRDHDSVVPNVVRDRESYSLEDIRTLIARSIRRYDEDKIGEPDHALESAGATVISTRCTEEHKWGHAQYSLFGIPIWSWTTSPRLAIQDGIKPGQCWAFKGDQGYLVIKLAGLVRPTSFTIEHLSKNLSPTGRIDSAPKDFEVLGLISEQGPPVLLGKYTYEDNDQPLQNFQVQTKLDENDVFPFVELRILNNHGNADYTCLYRFRVHGALVQRGH